MGDKRKAEEKLLKEERRQKEEEEKSVRQRTKAKEVDNKDDVVDDKAETSEQRLKQKLLKRLQQQKVKSEDLDQSTNPGDFTLEMEIDPQDLVTEEKKDSDKENKEVESAATPGQIKSLRRIGANRGNTGHHKQLVEGYCS